MQRRTNIAWTNDLGAGGALVLALQPTREAWIIVGLFAGDKKATWMRTGHPMLRVSRPDARSSKLLESRLLRHMMTDVPYEIASTMMASFAMDLGSSRLRNGRPPLTSFSWHRPAFAAPLASRPSNADFRN